MKDFILPDRDFGTPAAKSKHWRTATRKDYKMHVPVKNNWRTTLLPLAALLSACATPLPASRPHCPQLPPKPVATQPPPRLPYSASARINIERWQQQLTATPATQPPSAIRGRSE